MILPLSSINMAGVLESATEEGVLGSSMGGLDLTLSVEEEIWDSSEGEGVLESAVKRGRGVA